MTLHQDFSTVVSRPRLIPLLCVTWLIAIPCQAQQAVVTEARALIQQGDANAALSVLSEAASQGDAGQRAEVLNAKGWVLYQEGRYDDARVIFDQALEQANRSSEPDTLSVKILNNTGINDFASGELDSARQAFESARDQNSSVAPRYLEIIERQQRSRNALTHVGKGIERRLGRDFHAAIAEYDRALEVDPSNNDALSYRGYAYYRLGDYAAARRDIEATLAGSPRRLDALINLLKVDCASRPEELEGDLADYRDVINANREALLADAELARVCPDIVARWR